MPRRTPLPPPPPHLRTWPDDRALLADRHRILNWLTGYSIGAARLTLFLLLVIAVQIGWLVVGQALMSLAGATVDPATLILGATLAAFGAGIMIAAGAVLGLMLHKDGKVRRLIHQWAALADDPVGDARYRMPVASLCWLLISFLTGALGLWMSFAAPASARRGEETYLDVAYVMGAGTIFWIAGLIGVTKAVAHYRLAVRLATVRVGRQAGPAE